MRLQEYLGASNVSEAEFGKLLGVSQVAVHRYVTGQRIPAREIMTKIISATDGNVLPNDFYNLVAA